jgi:hypothetical protein
MTTPTMRVKKGVKKPHPTVARSHNNLPLRPTYVMNKQGVFSQATNKRGEAATLLLLPVAV